MIPRDRSRIHPPEKIAPQPNACCHHAHPPSTTMDLIDLAWNLSQDEHISDLKADLAQARGKDAGLVKRLHAENHELRIRLSLLIRLLIERNVFTAADFTT